MAEISNPNQRKDFHTKNIFEDVKSIFTENPAERRSVAQTVGNCYGILQLYFSPFGAAKTITFLFCLCFILPQRHWLSSCGMCALGESRVIHHCQEMCCTQQVRSHPPLFLQLELQILKRCRTCTLQTTIYHYRAVLQTTRQWAASSTHVKEPFSSPSPVTGALQVANLPCRFLPLALFASSSRLQFLLQKWHPTPLFSRKA